MKKISIIIVLLFVLVHVIASYARLSYYTRPDDIQKTIDIILSISFGIGLGGVTMINVTYGNERYINILLSIIDGFGAFLYYNTGFQIENIEVLSKSIILGLITSIGIYTISEINQKIQIKNKRILSHFKRPGKNNTVNRELIKKVAEMSKKGLSQRKIAGELNISQGKVCRILNQ